MSESLCMSLFGSFSLLYSSNTILHLSFCVGTSSHLTLGRCDNIVEVVLTAVVIVCRRLVVLDRSLGLMVDSLVLLLLVSSSWIHISSALMFLDETRVQKDHTLVHDLEVRGHQVEITSKLLVNQGFNLVSTANLNHKALI